MPDLLMNMQESIYQGTIDAGLRLAQLPESQGGWAEYFDADKGLDIEDQFLKAGTAIMLENTKRWLHRLCGGRLDENGRMIINEATRAAMLGGFSDHLFPVIRAAFPTNPINDLVSVQPTTKHVATVTYWNWIYGSNKGDIAKGQRLFDANTGVTSSYQDYTSETIKNEKVTGALTNGGQADDTWTGTLAYHDGGGVRPGSVQMSVVISANSPATVSDTGNGTLVMRNSAGNLVVLAASSINYTTGVLSFHIDQNGGQAGWHVDNAVATAIYQWNSEGSDSTPEVDIQITTSTVETQRRPLKLNYSAEAVQNAMAEWGLSLETNLVAGASELLNYETARQCISKMWEVAPVYGTWDVTRPAGISLEQHFRSITYTLNGASNLIWKNTQKGFGNFIVVDNGAATVIESLPRDLFEPAPRPASVQGLHFIGTLNGKFRVYKDLFLSNETGASVVGNILMGWKGNQFFEAGLVLAPFNMLYTTDTLTTANFISQKGMASRYALKMVNPNFYVRISFVQT